jgi:putative Holliday junction resolvase
MEKRSPRLLGLDYGSTRIGVAVSDPLGVTAQPLAAIRREGDRKDIEKIAALARELGVGTVVIGLPLLLDGTEGTQAAKARAFGEKVGARLALPVKTVDERLTTVQAERHLIQSGIRREKRKDLRDSLSAALILQCAMDATPR